MLILINLGNLKKKKNFVFKSNFCQLNFSGLFYFFPRNYKKEKKKIRVKSHINWKIPRRQNFAFDRIILICVESEVN